MSAPLALALALALALPGLGAHADQAAPEGCAVEGLGWTCQWHESFQQMAAAVNHSVDHAIPVFGLTLATLTVSHNGTNQGWRVAVMEKGPNGTIEVTKTERPAGPSTDLVQGESTTHVFALRAGCEYTLRFWDEDYAEAGLTSYDQGVASFGEFTLTYRAEPVPAGVPPPRPAATRDDPQLSGQPDEAPADLDIIAAWMDDAALGDGLFDAHVAVQNLSRIEFPTPVGVPGAAQAKYMRWTYNFSIAALDYALQWEIMADPASPTGYANDGCELLRGAERQVVARPLCEIDVPNATLSAIVPERIVGPPGDGTLFTDMRASSTTLVQRDPTVGEITWHSTGPQRYPFALGGPGVWDVLNPRLKTPASAPWYRDPLSSDNLPNTLQVAGAVVAVVTFLGGFVLVRRRHLQTKKLLDRVEAIARAPLFDTPRTLLALGELESEFTTLFRRGRITEGQYQILSQRIASVATRYALRRELGLDDGVPGPDGPARRVPVVDRDDPARPLSEA